MIVEPEAEVGGEGGDRRPRAVDVRERRQLAILRARIAAIDAGKVRRERQGDDAAGTARRAAARRDSTRSRLP